jgi:hypothetical protein
LGSSPAAASTITSVIVTIGPQTYTPASVGWSFPVTLQPGQDLVLTQSFNPPPNDTTSFNFDTSDVLGPNNFASIAISVDGVTTIFTDTNQVLNVKGLDTLSNVDNEAQNYGAPMNGPGYQVFLGYADNTHTGPCGAWASSIGLLGAPTCLPAPFFGATFFDGAGGLNPLTFDQTAPFHCDETRQLANCFEGGVIRIRAIEPSAPEPATMTVLLAGLAAMGIRRLGRSRKRT